MSVGAFAGPGLMQPTEPASGVMTAAKASVLVEKEIAR
jgi:hypothetical protein